METLFTTVNISAIYLLITHTNCKTNTHVLNIQLPSTKVVLHSSYSLCQFTEGACCIAIKKSPFVNLSMRRYMCGHVSNPIA